ncbi:outer membrane protein assembly factor BamA [Sphingosinicella humi]|uniref:Outer membrane protein assembly factor BamA n=1 Tax=Allosphingosinicella humi TaxID=2068657 RepID=A0A2U2IZA6_9SPHN|nr:outer membrane protein assembly factor BamA [Sphingosinicella humi]PWG01416.1 outer membrane protein assembly factor BamA [Sphingosinicella humi]
MKASSYNRRLCSALLVGTILGGIAVPAYAQETVPADTAPPADTPPQSEAPATTPPVAPGSAPAASILAPPTPIGTIRSISVTGGQRLEAQTVLSYTDLRVGEPYTRERLDEALRDLYATELFSDVQIRDNQGALTIQVTENPVINRIILEGNERLKNDKISPEIRLAPREIFTRSKVRADVARIIELYRRQGRFAATVEPKIVELDQNRVDLIFEINEGPRSKVRQINILGNEAFSDGDLRDEMATKETGLLSFLGSSNTFDPDRLAFDQQKLRQFYLTEGYADFRVISAVAELTPDKRDFIITYVVEEGERYRFGDVNIESELRDLDPQVMRRFVSMETGDWYNAKRVEDTITLLNETAGLYGYAFADARPQFKRNEDERTMDVTFRIADAPRVYVERIDINGNTVTRDKVIRREFRLAEGDPFNSVRVRRSRDRIQSLGFFQENLEIEQQQGSSPDRVVLAVDVEERATGELQVSAGFSSLERFLVNLSIRQRNFMGKGQELRAAANYSSYSKSVELGFTEPYLFDRNISLGGDIYRRDFSSFNFVNNSRNTTYEQLQTGGQIRLGIPLTEYMSLAMRYGLNLDDITLDRDIFFTDPDGDGPLPPVCDPLRAGRYLCDAIGERTTSSIGYSLLYDTLDNRLRPTRGERLILSQDYAGLGGSVNYVRTRASADKYFPIDDSGFVFAATIEGGYIHSFEDAPGPGRDPVRLIDRFFLGESQMRGFDIRGIGPRVIRRRFDADGNIIPGKDGIIADDALGGRAYYMGRAEVQIPFGKDMGLRPSVFVDVGAVFGLDDPTLVGISPDDPRARNRCVDVNGNSTPAPTTGGCPTGSIPVAGVAPFQEFYVGDTPKPRVSVGFGVNWISPFGPFRIDIAKALITAEGDDTKLFTFNVGTAF